MSRVTSGPRFYLHGALVGPLPLIRYHRRGRAGSAHTLPPVSVADHAADAGNEVNITEAIPDRRLGDWRLAGRASPQWGQWLGVN